MLVVKNLPANAGDIRDTGLIPGLGRSSGEGNGTLLQSSCLENPMDRGAWMFTVHRVAKSWTRLRDCTRVTILWKPEEAKACSQYSEHPVNWDHPCLMHIQSTCRGDPRWACGRYACHFLQLTALGRHPVPWRHLGKSGFYFVFARTGSSRNCPYKSISASF